MIDTLVWQMIHKYHLYSGDALILGDQVDSQTGESMRDGLHAVGYTCVTDLDYNGKATVNWDLNIPYTAGGVLFDLIFDGGVAEHVANIGSVFRTIIKNCKVNGTVIQVVPVNCVGESYYNLTPELLHDIYWCNNFHIKELFMFHNASLSLRLSRRFGKLFRWLPWRAAVNNRIQRIEKIRTVPAKAKNLPPRTHVIVVATKLAETMFIWPNQICYPKH